MNADLRLAHLFLEGAIAAAVTIVTLSISPQFVAAPTLSEASAQHQDQALHDAVGAWEGITIAVCPGSPANRCNAQQKVTITLVENANSRLSGTYECAYGNVNCLNMNQTGKVVDVDLIGRLLRLRVLMSDGMSCLFNGRIAQSTINGGYSCKAGTSLRERGSWRAKRTP